MCVCAHVRVCVCVCVRCSWAAVYLSLRHWYSQPAPDQWAPTLGLLFHFWCLKGKATTPLNCFPFGFGWLVTKSEARGRLAGSGPSEGVKDGGGRGNSLWSCSRTFGRKNLVGDRPSSCSVRSLLLIVNTNTCRIRRLSVCSEKADLSVTEGHWLYFTEFTDLREQHTSRASG